MRYFLASIFILIAVVKLIAVSAPQWIYPEDYFIWRYKLETALPQVDRSKVLVIGDSTVMSSVDPALIQDGWLNFGIPCGSVFDAWTLTKKLQQNKTMPKVMVISFHEYIFSFYEACFQESSLGFNLTSWSDLSDYADNMDLSIRNHPTSSLKINRNLLMAETLMSRLMLHPSQLSQFREVVFSAEDTARTEADLLKTKGLRHYGNEAEFPRHHAHPEFNEFVIAPIMDHYLREILKICEDEKVPVYFVNPLLIDDSVAVMSKAAVEGRRKYFEALRAEFPHFTYFNQQLYLPPDYFLDRVHVNEDGTRKFSEFLKDLTDKNLIDTHQSTF